MIESLGLLLLILGAIYAWQNALRAREHARAHCRDLCARAGVQLLDQTVALRRMRLERVPGHGLRLRRCYGFEFSTNGADRLRASLDLVGDELVAHDLPLADASAAHEPPRGGNVIELRPTTRTLH